MQAVELKLKQASAVLGMPPKELQNLVQFGVVRPKRRRGLCVFDTYSLYEAQVAEYLKATLGAGTERLAKFVEAFSVYLKSQPAIVPDFIVFKSEIPSAAHLMEIKLPLKELAESIEARLQRVQLYKDLPRGRKSAGWKREFLHTLQEAAEDLGDVSPDEIARTIREYRRSRRQKPEITVVAEAAKA